MYQWSTATVSDFISKKHRFLSL